MGISKQYQFRADIELESSIKSVWVEGMNRSDNIVRIIKAGILTLKTKKGAIKNE